LCRLSLAVIHPQSLASAACSLELSLAAHGFSLSQPYISSFSRRLSWPQFTPSGPGLAFFFILSIFMVESNPPLPLARSSDEAETAQRLKFIRSTQHAANTAL
jgi:hypothetical protein